MAKYTAHARRAGGLSAVPRHLGACHSDRAYELLCPNPMGTRMRPRTLAQQAPHADRLTVRGVDLEVVRRGSGRAIVFLHGFQTLDPEARFLELLSRKACVLAPSHPGFGASARPDGFETVYDLVHLYRELLDGLPDHKVTLIGASFGGWLAAEVAASCPHRLDRLVLIDALGIKPGDRETPDILDVFNTHPDTVRKLSWHDPQRFAPDFDALS